MKKVLILGVIALFIGLAFIPSFNAVSISMLDNHPPYVPDNYYPDEIYVDIDTNLSWDGGDPDFGNTVIYEIHLGKHILPPVIATIGPYLWNQTRIEYDPPDNLEYSSTYYMMIVAYDNHLAFTDGPLYTFTTVSENNHPPDEPTIDGPIKGIIGKNYTFSFSAEDPDNDDVSFYIEWEDGTSTGWTDYFKSGEIVLFSHTWNKIDDYTIRCKAKDTYDAEGNWSDVLIHISKDKAITSSFLLSFLERFPLLHRLLDILRWSQV